MLARSRIAVSSSFAAAAVAAGFPCGAVATRTIKRQLHLHECQSMAVMRRYGAKTPEFAAAKTAEEAEAAARKLKGDVVVKAQVHTGGRGLGFFRENNFQGGVHICTNPKQVREVADQMLGKTLVTKQTGKEGKPCNLVLVCERMYLRQERYLALLVDRAAGGAMLLGSAVGGTSIEEIAERHPEAIVKMPVPVNKPMTRESALEFTKKLGFEEAQMKEAADSVMGLHRMFIEKDCTMLEVNPFAETHDGRVLVCDAKVNFDDNAAFRQKDIFQQADLTQVDAREVQAGKHDLNYVGLTGDLGCMVNGAGLAMATMDLIQLCGGWPANFLDVGGGAQGNQIVEALRLLQEDSQVRAILINIFGGIMRCDIIAAGIIEAGKSIGLKKPLVVRLEGTNKDAAKKLLDESGMKIFFESDFERAAQKAVKMAEIVKFAESAKLAVSFQ